MTWERAEAVPAGGGGEQSRRQKPEGKTETTGHGRKNEAELALKVSCITEKERTGEI